MIMINRKQLIEQVEAGFKRSPIVALTGVRQCGKTTLARHYASDKEHRFFDLEDPADSKALDVPMLTLEKSPALVIIDEIQRKPALFQVLRVLADKLEWRTNFLILGSASPDLVKGASESLAGRVAFVDMAGFSHEETGADAMHDLWNRGGLPRSFLADDDNSSYAWRGDYIRTFLERDIPQLGIRIPAESLRRFWTMLAHYHGQTWNGAELATSLGVSAPTVRHYLDILTGAFVV
ncbi:hypothetical protein BVY04_00250, partial [bacterium M21]